MGSPVLPERKNPETEAERHAGNEPSPKRFHIRKRKTNPRRIALLTLLLFASPPGLPLLVFGAVCLIAGVLLHGWAAGYLARAGYEERETILTVRGPYRHNRNPYYLAQMTLDLGFFCLAGLPFFYLLYFPVIFSVYRFWVLNEEKFLEEEFGEDYRAFKKDVPRWAFRLTPAPARGREQTFTWAMYRLNRELPRSLSHLFFLGLFGVYFLAGNPFSGIDPVIRLTVIVFFVGWLSLHDIYPLDVSQKSPAWMVLGAVIAVSTVIFLYSAPVWEFWPPSAAWPAVIAGLAGGLFVAATASPMVPHHAGKKNGRIFARPMSQW
ncbi:MAG TPA: isoprenylcysteine carboxylmethyltransferase family protein, partial [Nitrospiria bacterium]